MKKTIKSWVKPEKTFECSHCKCQFISDEYTESTLNAYKNVVQYTDKCPECKRKVIVSEDI